MHEFSGLLDTQLTNQEASVVSKELNPASLMGVVSSVLGVVTGATQ